MSDIVFRAPYTPTTQKIYSMLASYFSFQPESCYVVKSGTSQTTYLHKARKDVLIYFLWVKSMRVFEEMIQKCIENFNMICPF